MPVAERWGLALSIGEALAVVQGCPRCPRAHQGKEGHVLRGGAPCSVGRWVPLGLSLRPGLYVCLAVDAAPGLLTYPARELPNGQLSED